MRTSSLHMRTTLTSSPFVASPALGPLPVGGRGRVTRLLFLALRFLHERARSALAWAVTKADLSRSLPASTTGFHLSVTGNCQQCAAAVLTPHLLEAIENDSGPYEKHKRYLWIKVVHDPAWASIVGAIAERFKQPVFDIKDEDGRKA